MPSLKVTPPREGGKVSITSGAIKVNVGALLPTALPPTRRTYPRHHFPSRLPRVPAGTGPPPITSASASTAFPQNHSRGAPEGRVDRVKVKPVFLRTCNTCTSPRHATTCRQVFSWFNAFSR